MIRNSLIQDLTDYHKNEQKDDLLEEQELRSRGISLFSGLLSLNSYTPKTHLCGDGYASCHQMCRLGHDRRSTPHLNFGCYEKYICLIPARTSPRTPKIGRKWPVLAAPDPPKNRQRIKITKYHTKVRHEEACSISTACNPGLPRTAQSCAEPSCAAKLWYLSPHGGFPNSSAELKWPRKRLGIRRQSSISNQSWG